MEFPNRFEQCRFEHPPAGLVREKLVDERVFTD